MMLHRVALVISEIARVRRFTSDDLGIAIAGNGISGMFSFWPVLAHR
jgi:hypothetical protein